MDVFNVFGPVSDWHKTQEICDRVVSEDPFLTVFFPDKYKSQRMCDEAVDDTLATLTFIPDWFVTSKMIKSLYTAFYADANILYFDEDSGNVVFYCNELDILNIDLKNVNLDNDFKEDDPDAIILMRLLTWHIKFGKRTELEKKRSEELIPIVSEHYVT